MIFLLQTKGNEPNFSSRSDVCGLVNRPDGAMPAFSSPSAMCSKCKGHFPSHMLTSIFYPSSYVSDASTILFPPTSALLPPLPWGISKLVKYVCGNCNEEKIHNVEGKFSIDENTKLTTRDCCHFALVNLTILANPTYISRTTPPRILQESRNKSPNKSQKYHQFFSLDDIFEYLNERAEYFNLSRPNLKRYKTKSKKRIYDALRGMNKNGSIMTLVGEDKLVYYALSEKGYYMQGMISRETLPQHFFSIMEKFPTKPMIRASSIAKAYPETMITWSKRQILQYKKLVEVCIFLIGTIF